MFTENEIGALIIDNEIKNKTQQLKEKFIEKEAPYLDLSDHDFLSLVLLTPSVGVALANNSISLMEEMALNKKARKYSKGGYFLKKDPVVNAMGYLIKNYTVWSDVFYAHIKDMIEELLDKETLMQSDIADGSKSDEEFCVEILKSPFILVRALSSFLSNSEEEDFSLIRNLPKIEYDRIIEILEKVGIMDIPLVKKHMTKLVVK
jgi:hypothetical protein